MNEVMSDRLRRLIQETDLDANPLLVSEGARLLSEVQQWEGKGQRLEIRLAALERPTEGSISLEQGKTLADRAYEILVDHGGAMPYQEIAAGIRSRGFEHAREPKNPEKQLGDSVWTAMHEDDRFTKVGRGIFDLTERL
jgi:hypothetical protein